MKKFPNISSINPDSLDGLNHLGKFLDNTQFLSGAIPSNKDGSHDPWDHLEAVMGLTTLGYNIQALKGLHWMSANQNEDGSWYNLYQDEEPLELNKQTNHASYIAVAVWHFYLINNDVNFLQEFWEPVKKGILFSLSLQHSNGAIAWNIDEFETIDEDYLLTGCSSTAKSLECAIAICQALGNHNYESEWRIAHSKLIAALENPYGIFDLKKDRSRFSMDWYYPILAGIYDESEAIKKINSKWDIFINEDFGCRCVSDRPWITVAETSELIITLDKIDETKKAKDLFEKVSELKDPKDNIFWMGYVFDDEKYWPIEKPTWTAAAYILAANALCGFTSTGDFFKRL